MGITPPKQPSAQDLKDAALLLHFANSRPAGRSEQVAGSTRHEGSNEEKTTAAAQALMGLSQDRSGSSGSAQDAEAHSVSHQVGVGAHPYDADDEDSSCIEVLPLAIPVPQHPQLPAHQPLPAQAPTCPDRTQNRPARLDPGFMPSAANDFKFVYDSPTSTTALELDQLLEAPLLSSRDERDTDGLQTFGIVLSFKKLETKFAATATKAAKAADTALEDEDMDVS
ncbi:hypothetical protein NX059_000897 [Plenodomus lindquistii]|nr:hypothetical protein NX059_000897 [Plenodomus lindquistii]